MKRLALLIGMGLIWLSLATSVWAQISTSNLRTATWNIDIASTLDSRGGPTIPTGSGLSFYRVGGSPRFGIGMNTIPSESFHIRGVSKLHAPFLATYLIAPSPGHIDWRQSGIQEISIRNTNFAVAFDNPPSINFGLNTAFNVVSTTLILMVRVQANAGGSITGWSATGASIVFKNGPGASPSFPASAQEVVYPIFFYYTKTLANGSTYYGDY